VLPFQVAMDAHEACVIKTGYVIREATILAYKCNNHTADRRGNSKKV